MSQAETALQKYDQPVVELTGFFVVMMCGGAHAHMHVCVGGVPHSFVLHWKLRRWNVCLPAVLSTEGDGREWGAHQAQLLTHFHLLLWGRGCICSCMLGLKRGSHNDIPLALTHFGLSCIFNPSNAKLPVVLLLCAMLKSVTVPHPSVNQDKGM